MPTKARAKMLKDTYQEKTRFKLYKKGHTWAIAGLTLLFSGVLATQQIQVTHAATTDADVTSSATDTNTTKSASATLASSAVDATIGDQTLTVGDTAAIPTVTMADGIVAPDWTLDDFDLSKVDTEKAGTYAVTLSAAGLAKLQAANPSQVITASNAVAGSVTVKAAATDANATTTAAATTSAASTTSTQPAATTTTATPQVKTQVDAQQAVTATVGNATKTYDSNNDNPATVTVTLSDGAKAPSSWYFTGTANTYQINTSTGDVAMSADGQPGTSAITLSAQGIAALQAANPEATVSAANVTAGTLTISQKSVAVGAITIADQSKAHDGDATTDPTTYNVTLPDDLTAPSTWTKNSDGTYALTTTAGDIAVADDASQQVGSYAVTLTDQALAALQAANPTFAITAKNVATGTFTIQSLGNVMVSSTTISTTDTTLPATIPVSVSQSLKVPDDWVWSYQSPTANTYNVPLTADNFDLSQVQLGTTGSYDISLSDGLKATLQTLNPNVALTDDQYSAGQVFVTAATISSNKYTPSWLIAQVKGMNFTWGDHDVDDAMVVGEPYQLQVGLYMNGVNPMYDGITEYLILPDGFSVTDAEGSSTKASDPAQVIADSIDADLAVSAPEGYKGVTVTQLADFKGRETFEIVLHTDGTDQAFNYSDSTVELINGGNLASGVFEIPIVVDASVAGTTLMINGSQANPEASVVYITDDPAVTGGNYSLNVGSYPNIASVAAAMGVLNAHGLADEVLGNPYNVKVVAAKVVQTYNLVTSAGTLLDTVTKTGVNGESYSPLELLPNTLTVNGVTYYLATDQVADLATLNPGVGEKADLTTMTVAATPINVLYRTAVEAATVEVNDQGKTYDNDETTPSDYLVTLPAGLNAPSDWQATGVADQYQVAANSGDLDLSAIVQTAGANPVTLSDAGLRKLSAANGDDLISRDAVKVGTLQITAVVTTDYTFPEGVDTTDLATEQTHDVQAKDDTFTFGTSDTDFVVPTFKGYTASVTDASGATQTLSDGQQLSFTSDGTNQTYQVTYTKDAPTINSWVITKTVHYQDESGNQLADDFVTSATVEQIVDAATGEATTPEATLGFQNYPTIAGYHAIAYPVQAVSNTQVIYGDANEIYVVTYTKDQTTTVPDTVTKTVEYVDGDGNTLAPDYTVKAAFTKTTDTYTGDVTVDPDAATLGHQANPTIKGYHVVTSPAEATADQTVHFGDSDHTYQVVYEKDAPTITTDTVTKTVHYVDEAGNTLAKDFTDEVTFTQSTDAVTDENTYAPETATLGYQADPTIKGYHIVTSPVAATTTQTVKYGDSDGEYTVIYAKDAPTIATDTVTKTVHYVDQDGNAIAEDYTDTANFTRSTDAVTGEQSYTPESATLGHQANPTIAGYHVVESPAAATTDQTVEFGYADENYTVVYNKNTPAFGMDTVTKTVHYVDQDGNTIAPDYTTHANFTAITDPVTGAKTYGPTTATLGYQADPAIKGYHVVDSPAAATTAQTVQYGDADVDITVVYNKNTPAFGMDTVTKTVHYVDQNGNTIAPDYTTHANFTEIIDPVTGAKSYGPESATLGYQADPTIAGYHIVTSPAGATSAQTVQYGDEDVSYTVVYAKDEVADNGGTTTGGKTTPRGTLPDTSVGEPSSTTTATTSNTASRTSLPATDAPASTHGQLPQTGDQHESLLAILGVSLLSLLGIAGLRRKRDE